MQTALSSKGQVVIPADLRRQDDLRAGDCFEIERLESGQYLLKRTPAPANQGLVDWLLACPQKGWIERPDLGTTDDVRSPF